MLMFGILGAPAVDWSITLDGGRMDAPAGSPLRAIVSLRPRQSIDARRVMAALVGTEEYKYSERTMTQRSNSSTTTWGDSEQHRQEIQLIGPGPIGAGELRSGPVEFLVPPDASPSLESNVLRMRWKLIAWIDVGGRDPKIEQSVMVPLTTAQLDPGDAASMGPQVQTVMDGQPVSIWAQPAPIRAGAPFSGAVDVTTPLSLSDTRVELKLNVSSRMSGGIPGATLLALAGFSSTAENGLSETQVLWRGSLTDGGPAGALRRYLFGGQLPLAPIVTAVYAHGVATATLDVIISRRLRSDVHITRPVAIVTG
jgi:hypothetical protein